MPAARTPLDHFKHAVRVGDPTGLRVLLQQHPELRESVNAPVFAFGQRAASVARKSVPVIDVLLEYGADLNLKSDWWAGPFGILEYDITLEEAHPLIERGAIVDIFGAAHLGLADRVRALVDADPGLVSARGGDGKTALHCAATPEIAAFLLDRGAEIDARDVDHESTAAQYLVRSHPDVTRMLTDRGAWFDIFIAVGLRDRTMVEHSLDEDPEALDHRIGQGLYTTVHRGRPSSRAEIGRHRGDIYRWVFDHHGSALDVARQLGFSDILELLMQRATPVQRLLAACAAGDRRAAAAIVMEHPTVVSSLSREQLQLFADKAHANDTAAVSLMADLGFDPLVGGSDDFEPLRWAVFHGNVEMTRRLLQCEAPLNTPDRSYGGTPLANCIYGSLHGWSCDSSPCDYGGTVRLLLDAGERIKPEFYPTGVAAVDAVLKEYLR